MAKEQRQWVSRDEMVPFNVLHVLAYELEPTDVVIVQYLENFTAEHVIIDAAYCRNCFPHVRAGQMLYVLTGGSSLRWWCTKCQLPLRRSTNSHWESWDQRLANCRY